MDEKQRQVVRHCLLSGTLLGEQHKEWLHALLDDSARAERLEGLPASLRESARLCRDPQFGPNEQMARGFEKAADAVERALSDHAEGEQL